VIGERFTPISTASQGRFQGRAECLPLGYLRRHVFQLEQRGSGYQNGRSGFHAGPAGLGVDPSVHGDLDPSAFGLGNLSDLRYLRDAVRYERLASETGVDGHDQDQVRSVQERLHLFGGGLGVQGNPCLQASGLYLVYGAQDVAFRFAVDGYDVASRVREGVDVPHGVLYHQVGVEDHV
jgi:hypothetical protein